MSVLLGQIFHKFAYRLAFSFENLLQIFDCNVKSDMNSPMGLSFESLNRKPNWFPKAVILRGFQPSNFWKNCRLFLPVFATLRSGSFWVIWAFKGYKFLNLTHFWLVKTNSIVLYIRLFKLIWHEKMHVIRSIKMNL